MSRKLLVAPAFALIAVACGETVAPVESARVLQGGNITRAVVGPTTTYPTGASVSNVRLCKVVPAGSPSGVSFNFTVTVTPVIPAGPAEAPEAVSLQAGECADVHMSSLDGAELAKVEIVEGVLPAGWANTNIDVVQIMDGSTYLPPAPGLSDSEDETTRTATVYINDDMGRLVTFTNTFTEEPPPPPGGGEGCTPGYWKQKQHFDSYPAGYSPDMSFNAALGLPGTALFADSFTLLDALGLGGGGKNALARHAAAAILTAASGGVDYDLSVADVQAAVLAAYNDASLIEAKKNLLANFNEQGCPLN